MAKIPNYTQKTLALLRDLGYTADVAERWVPAPHRPGGGVRRDLFNFLDVLCLHEGLQGVLGVQSTSYGGISSHVAKIRAEERAGLWLRTGNGLWLFGWERHVPNLASGKPGKAMRWRARVYRFTEDSFSGRGRPEEITLRKGGHEREGREVAAGAGLGGAVRGF